MFAEKDFAFVVSFFAPFVPEWQRVCSAYKRLNGERKWLKKNLKRFSGKRRELCRERLSVIERIRPVKRLEAERCAERLRIFGTIGNYPHRFFTGNFFSGRFDLLYDTAVSDGEFLKKFPVFTPAGVLACALLSGEFPKTLADLLSLESIPKKTAFEKALLILKT